MVALLYYTRLPSRDRIFRTTLDFFLGRSTLNSIKVTGQHKVKLRHRKELSGICLHILSLHSKTGVTLKSNHFV